jgi:hypothetical protein
VCCVAFWFTRRADIFRRFVGNPKDINPGSITQMIEKEEKNQGTEED